MAQAMADMELEPYNLGDNILEEPDDTAMPGGDMVGCRWI